MEKVKEFISKNFTFNTILNIILIVFVYFLYTSYNTQIEDSKKNQEMTEKLMYALQDSMRIVIKANGEMSYERKTLQAELKDLKRENLNLNANQRFLLSQIESTKNLISAGLVDISVRLSGMTNNNSNFTNDSTVNFTYNSDSLKYNIDIKGVAKYKNLKPSMTFNNIETPNKMVVDFKWGEKKEGYPVSFSVTNTNPLYKVNDIQSYAIPQLDKREVKPTRWQKFKRKYIKIGKYGVGVGLGAGMGLLLLK
jgi:hypothetical protein